MAGECEIEDCGEDEDDAVGPGFVCGVGGVKDGAVGEVLEV